MTHLLETSVLVEPLAPTPSGGAQYATSIVCVGELEAAVLLADDPGQTAARLRRLTTVVSNLLVLDVDARVSASYAQLRAATGRIPSTDLWIAATALAHGLVLVTRDERLARLPGVTVDLVND